MESIHSLLYAREKSTYLCFSPSRLSCSSLWKKPQWRSRGFHKSNRAPADLSPDLAGPGDRFLSLSTDGTEMETMLVHVQVWCMRNPFLFSCTTPGHALVVTPAEVGV